jgi:hypothetical protein
MSSVGNIMNWSDGAKGARFSVMTDCRMVMGVCMSRLRVRTRLNLRGLNACAFFFVSVLSMSGRSFACVGLTWFLERG